MGERIVITKAKLVELMKDSPDNAVINVEYSGKDMDLNSGSVFFASDVEIGTNSIYIHFK